MPDLILRSASSRVSTDEWHARGRMVRDGAKAPPHHEGLMVAANLSPRILSPPHARTAVHRQRYAGNKTRFIGRQKQRGVGDIPAGAHLLAQRHLAVTLGLDFGAALAPFAGA